MSTTPSGLVSPDTPFGSPPPPEASTPPARPPANIPTFITPPAPPSIPPVWEHVIDVLMKLPTTTAEGQNMRSWVTFHSLTSLEDFLMWELDTLQYDAITVCFPSGDTTSPNSLVSLKPNSNRHLIMLSDRIPSTTPGAEPPRDAKDSGSARSHSTHLETSSSNRP